jgi:hypothetical protein
VSGPRHELQELLDWLQGVRKRQMFLGFDPSAWTYLYDIPVWYAIHICFVASFSSAAIARPMFTCVWPQGGGQLQWEQRRAGWIACHDRYRAPTRIYILEEDIQNRAALIKSLKGVLEIEASVRDVAQATEQATARAAAVENRRARGMRRNRGKNNQRGQSH